MTPAFRIARSSSCRVRAWPAVRLGGPRVLSHGPPRRDPAVRERLRAVIRRIEETGPGWTGGESAALSLGVGEIDAHLPWGGLPAGALHEIVAADTGAVGRQVRSLPTSPRWPGTVRCSGARAHASSTPEFRIRRGCGASASSPNG